MRGPDHSPKKKILFVTPYYKPYLGGIERVIEKLSEQFLASPEVGEIAVLTTKWSFPRRFNPGWPGCEVIDGIKVYRVDSFPSQAPPFFQVPLVWFPPQQFAGVIRQFRPDIVQLMTDKWFWGNFWSWFWARRRARTYLSPSFHDLSLLKQPLRLINGILGRIIDGVQVITALEKKKVVQAYRIPEEKITVIPWGVDLPKEVAPLRSKEEVGLLTVGRISQHKGQDWLVKVLSQIEETVTRKYRLILVGEDEGYGEELRRLIRRRGVVDRIEFRGKVSDRQLEEAYLEADVFVLFPDYEAFGLVFLEAMSHRLPVLTHDVGAVGEVLGSHALIIDPYNAAQARVVLNRLIEDDSYRHYWADRGHEYARNNFSWLTTSEKFLQFYQQETGEER